MTQTQWLEKLQSNYQRVAHSLISRGYTRQPRSDIYREQFVKIDHPTLVLVRHLCSPNWWGKEV